MANTNNTQTNKGFESIKQLKVVLASAEREAQQSIANVKQRALALSDAIRARKMEFARQEEESLYVETNEVLENTALVVEVVQPKEEKIEDIQPKEPVLEVAAPTVSDISNVKNETAEAKEVTPVAAEVQHTPKVVSVVVDGREVKTYTDDKGNVRVRKFLDTSATRQPQRQQQDKRQQGGAPSNTSRPARNGANGANRQGDRRAPYNKDESAQDKRTPQSKPNSGAKKFAAPVDIPRNDPQKSHGNKNKTKDRPDEKRVNTSKKSLITKDYSGDYDEDKVVRRNRKKSDSNAARVVAPKITHAVVSTKEVPIKVLSERIGVSASEIIKQLFKEGIMKTINDSVDFDYAEYVASLHGVELELKMEKTAEEIISMADADDGLLNDTKRAPIVTVMGHVDHGKTSLLDSIRNTSVTSGEAGGITQHIGAYTVTVHGETITFIDTPGHAAFTAMRARGAKITDVAIIVVAADDGVMPQTIEAINHAKAAEVSIIVAINKMDKPHVDPDRVKQQLTEYGLVPEEWGGDTIMVPLSAKTGMGIETLLESVLLLTEIKELKANPAKRATGTVLEARLDKGRGPVATILVSNGTLNVGDSLIAGSATGKIRAMFDDKGKKVKSAGPSMPVEVLGFSEVPQAGDYMYVADEKLVKKAAEERKDKIKLENARQTQSISLNDLFGRISEGQLKTLNIIIKTDVQGSLEALKSSLKKISNEEVKVSAIHGGVGGINETDIMLAKASNAIVIGFNVRADSNAKALAEREGVDIRTYSVIYDAVDDVTAAMKGMLAPKFRENVIGSVDVREVFKITGVGAVAGCYVTSGKAMRSAKVRIYRNDVSIYDGNILALKRFKDDVKEVASGYECGISVENYNDIKVGDVFEIYQMEEIAQ